MRRNHQENRILGYPINHVQTRSSLRTQGHTALISENIQNIKKSQEDMITSKTNPKDIKNIKKEDF